MPRFRRLVVPGYPHHVTQRGVRRQLTFFDDDDYDQYLNLANDTLDLSDLRIWAYCLMPNHIHAVVVPTNADSLANFFRPLHREYARLTNKKHEWSGHLWQGRFSSVPMEESHVYAALRYVELNPVRAGLVRAPGDWRWSSARAHLGLSSDPILDTSATDKLVDCWSKYLDVPERTDEFEQLRRRTRIGRPEGSDDFIRSIEAACGRRVRKKKRGRQGVKVSGT